MAQQILLKPSHTLVEDSNTIRSEEVEVRGNSAEVNFRPTYRVVLKKGLDGWIIAKCLDIKGAVTQGRSVDEALKTLKNIIEAISTILEDMGKPEKEFNIAIIPREQAGFAEIS